MLTYIPHHPILFVLTPPKNNYNTYLKIGTGILPFSVKIANLSAVTGVFNGDSLSFQSGINSSNAVVSMHAPDNI